MNSETPSYNQLTLNNEKDVAPATKWLAPLFLIFSFLGFLDSSYLAAKHYLGGIIPCTFGNCEKVLTSPYSMVFGVPVALWGVIYYLAILIVTVIYFDTKKLVLLKYLSLFSIVGLVASIWYVSIQLFIIKSICEFCILSAATSTLLFIFGMIYLANANCE